MTLNDYQKEAMTTCTKSSENFSYMMLNLVGEIGELSGKVAKLLRKQQFVINNNEFEVRNGSLAYDETSQLYEEMKKEAGDCLWQLSGLCYVMGWKLEDVAKQNLEKLASRKQRGVIVGEGDNR